MTTAITPAMRRSILIATLRDKTLWPKGFEWNYTRRETCAVGLAERLFGTEDMFISWRQPYTPFGLSGEQAFDVFIGVGLYQHLVTPEMVADRLEEMHRSLA